MYGTNELIFKANFFTLWRDSFCIASKKWSGEVRSARTPCGGKPVSSVALSRFRRILRGSVHHPSEGRRPCARRAVLGHIGTVRQYQFNETDIDRQLGTCRRVELPN